MNRIFLALLLTVCLTASSSQAKDLSQNKKSVLSDRNLEDEDFESYNTENLAEIYDPYESINRKIYVFNDAFDRYFFEYLAKAYRKGVPKPARKIVGNFINNLSLPISAVNSLLQGKVDNGLATFSNFLINSTIGVFGLFEIASEKGIRFNYEDFGQTMGHYDVGSGAYLMIPILGPSSMRDFGGWVFDRSISPTGFNALEIGGRENIVDSGYLIGMTVLSGVSTRESLIEALDNIRKDSFDPYATIRSAYIQKRNNEVNK